VQHAIAAKGLLYNTI